MNSEQINDAIDYEARNKVLEEENDKLKLQFTEVSENDEIYFILVANILFLVSKT